MKKMCITLLLFLLFSCVSNSTKYGTKTEIFDKKDSLQSLAKIKEIKSLDDADFNPGIFKEGKTAVNFRFLKPKNTDKTKKYPLILVFHGSGAIGTNNTSQMGVLSKMWLNSENREKYPTYVLSPQFPVRSSNYHFDESRNVKISQSNEYLDLVLKSLDSLIAKENIDSNRIYVMGFSMGGATTSNAISKRPDLFAAAINVSGISQFDQIKEIEKMPIWIVHGSLDTDNFPQSNFKFYEEMKDQGNIFFVGI